MSDYKSSEDLTYSHKELQQAELAEMAAIADVAIKVISSLSLNSFLRKLIDDNDLPSRWKTIRKKLTLHDKKWSNIPSKMQIDENLTHGETHIKDL